jgi:hypothetical protein
VRIFYVINDLAWRKSNSFHNVKIEVYKTTSSLVVLSGLEKWPLTLREEHRWRIFEKRIVRRTFESKKNIRRKLERLVNEELHNFNSSPNIMTKSRRMIWAGNVALLGEKRNSYRIFVAKTQGKRKLQKDLDIGGRIRLRCILKE